MSVPDADAARRGVRREVRAARRALSPAERARRSHAVCLALLRSGVLLRTRRVAAFWPNDGEVDLGALFPRFWQCGIELHLPVIAGPRLWFARLHPDTALADNRFGIPEPDVSRHHACNPLALDLVLMPLVAFDDAGRRLGMGGGYYDRTFAALRWRRALRRPRLVGVAFGFQHRDALPGAPWDVPLDAALTEDGYRRLPSR